MNSRGPGLTLFFAPFSCSWRVATASRSSVIVSVRLSPGGRTKAAAWRPASGVRQLGSAAAAGVVPLQHGLYPCSGGLA